MTPDPIAVLILSPWVLGPLLVWRFDLWRTEPRRSVEGWQVVDRKLMKG